MKFLTESGSIYEISGDHIRRINTEARKRADGEWVRLMARPQIEVGFSAILQLSTLAGYGPDDYENTVQVSPGGVTQRVTTPVERIWDNG